MTDLKERSTQEKNGQAFGWISGLGATVFPPIAAGIFSSIAGVFSEDWNPEVTFPRFLTVTMIGMVAWLVYGSIRIPAFKKGALYGGLISVAFAATMYGLIFFLQP
ncbi:MAG: hypothetical protein OEM40_00955 [Acidimicrobiia bacterium]|nr:hypothetical protein [Acidimicrobiia bacterium]MDH5372910.1 hypothetical protein [Acidimicrobiia bacterium]MDH5504297.1 hypothetical protein [Acidimicrobiia bacterium]